MNSTEDIVLKSLFGSPVFLKDICAVYCLTLGEIVRYGYSKFLQLLQTILVEKPLEAPTPEIGTLLSQLTDFQFIMFLAATDKEFNNRFIEAFRLFTKEKIIISLEAQEIIVGSPEEKHIMNEADFEELRRILRIMYFLSHENDDIQIDENDDPRVKKLKEQFKQNRRRVAQAKAKHKDGDGANLNFSDLIGSVAVGIDGMNIQNIQDITYYALHDQLQRMNWREQFEINNRAALAGAKLKKDQLQHWIKSISAQSSGTNNKNK